jgi:uncharacterized membrane protein YccC
MNLPKAYWIPLIVVIVVHHNMKTTFTRIGARTISTLIGVWVASIFFTRSIPMVFVFLILTTLSAFRPYLKIRNYTLYSVVMTLLVLILLEFGNPVTSILIVARLVNTMIGLLIAIILGYLLWDEIFLKRKLNSKPS